MKISRLMTSAIIALTITQAHAENLWQLGGFEAPESVLYDTQNSHIIVSNINGSPLDVDGNGYLSLVSPDGEMLEQKWATGMNAPKGMGIVGDQLLVADINQLHIVDLATGALTQSFDLEGAQFLNDISADGETAYISDMFTHTIWRFADNSVEIWLQDEALSHPNGLLIDGDELLVASWGKDIQDDFSTKTAGSLLAVSLDSKEIKVLAPEIGNLDGLVSVGDELLVTDWVSGNFYAVDAKGSVELISENVSGLADIGAHENTIFMPQMNEGTVAAISYP